MRTEYILRIHRANRERKQNGITFDTYVECLKALDRPDEMTELMLESKERVIEDARERAYYLVED